MIRRIILGAVFLCLFSGIAGAEELASDTSHSSYSGELLPPVIAAGMDAYGIEGPESAIKTWVKGGPLENDEKVLGSVALFREMEKYYGKYTGYRAISQKQISPEARLVYIQMNYEKGPLFLRFLCYLSGGRWVVSGRLVMNTDPVEVLKI